MASALLPLTGRRALDTWTQAQLEARVRLPGRGAAAVRRDGTHVVCWLQATRRLHDNWTLLAAQRAAAKLGRPLLVYQGLDTTYPYASPRSHTALLHGMAEVRRDADTLGISLIQPVVQPHTLRRGLLDAVAAGACCVITDAHPTAGIGQRTARVAARLAAAGIPLWRVESLSLTPARWVAEEAKAGGTHRHRRRLLTPEAWQDLHAVPFHEVTPYPDGDAWARLERLRGTAAARGDQGDALPRLTARDWDTPDALADVVARLAPAYARPDIGPVANAIITASEGMAALDRFVTAGGLAAYAAGAMDPAAGPASHSQLSAALHFGHLSPGAVLRHLVETGALDPTRAPDALPAGPRRWIDQIWTRRDVAIHWADAVGDVTSPDLVPAWARATLDAHTPDRTSDPQDPGEAALEAGTTGDDLWDATMRELRTTGRIHPYARMIWGKMLLQWAPDWRTAHARLFRLNDSWALDGRDAISALSLLWVLGLGDQPFPERARWGTVRPMLTRSSGKKFKAATYIAQVRATSAATTAGPASAPSSPPRISHAG